MNNKIIRKACQICDKSIKGEDLFPIALIDKSLRDFIIKKYPDCDLTGYICKSDLNAIRLQYVEGILKKERGSLSSIEKRFINNLKEQETVTKNINKEFEEQLTLGQKLSDKLASFGGSWKFIIIFGSFLFLWVIINTIVIISRHFDPYPFILLNLILSCLAAIQAPVIMMSQNRQEAKDRLRSRNDYIINLKAELEIRNLNEKVDKLLIHQWERLMEIEKIQMEILSELPVRRKS
jgi:uncharacterized membrane protein